MDIEKKIWKKIGEEEFEISNDDDTNEILSINKMRKRVKRFSLKPSDANFGVEIERKYLGKINDTINHYSSKFTPSYKGYNFKIRYYVKSGKEKFELMCSNGEYKEGWLEMGNINNTYSNLKQRIDDRL